MDPFWLLASIAVLNIASLHSADVPPPPKHNGYSKIMSMMAANQMDGVMKEIDEWSPADKSNIWELSGQFEGDIMTDDVKSWARNAVTDLSYKWPNGEVPYYIAKDFDEYEKSVILGAIDTFHDKTCIRFRPYKKGDRSWVSIQGDAPGCWSYVGRRGGGQVVNLGYRCVQHGVAAHELLHALGFYHQQSASDRDVYVTINWQNIRKGTERNFKKYSHRRVTDYGIGYDYSSVMHYSGYAFSKNGKPTIIPKDLTATIGQRARVSKKDLDKVNIMYSCSARYFSRVVNPFVSFWNFNYR